MIAAVTVDSHSPSVPIRSASPEDLKSAVLRFVKQPAVAAALAGVGVITVVIVVLISVVNSRGADGERQPPAGRIGLQPQAAATEHRNEGVDVFMPFGMRIVTPFLGSHRAPGPSK